VLSVTGIDAGRNSYCGFLPLIALMKNQVDAIRGVSDHDGVAHVLNSSLSKGDVQK